jgi:hypothetical protein
MGVGCIVAVANAIKKNDLFTAIIYLPFGVIMIAGGGMVLLWLISELPRKVVFIGISVAVIGGVAYWVKHSKLSIADIWKNSTPVLWQSIKVFAKMLLGLALLVGVVWGAVELLDSFGNTADIISLVFVLIFVLSAVFLIKLKTNRPRKASVTVTSPPPLKKPQLTPLEKKANQLWKTGDPKNNPEDFWTQYESLIKQVKDE